MTCYFFLFQYAVVAAAAAEWKQRSLQ